MVVQSPEANINLPALVGSSMLGCSGGATSNVTLRAKAVMLFERTARFACEFSSCSRVPHNMPTDAGAILAASSKSESDWAGQRSLEMSLAQFSANLPWISRHTNQFTPTRADVDLVSIHTLIYTATIHLHRDHIETQTPSFEKCLYAASSVAALVRELNEDDYAFLDPINSVSILHCAAVRLLADKCVFADLLALCRGCLRVHVERRTDPAAALRHNGHYE